MKETPKKLTYEEKLNIILYQKKLHQKIKKTIKYLINKIINNYIKKSFKN